MLNRPRELDSATPKTEATLSYETSEPSSYSVYGLSEESFTYQQTPSFDTVLFVLSNDYGYNLDLVTVRS
jgi:hypothetical protein